MRNTIEEFEAVKGTISENALLVEVLGDHVVFIVFSNPQDEIGYYGVANIDFIDCFVKFDTYAEATAYALALEYTREIMPLPENSHQKIMEATEKIASCLDDLYGSLEFGK